MTSDPVVLDNFITTELADKLCAFLDPKLGPENNKIYTALGFQNSIQASKAGFSEPALHGIFNPEDSLIVSELGNIYVRVRDILEKYFGVEMDLVNAIYQKLITGASNSLHSDSSMLDGSPWQKDGTPEELEWSALLYLNNYDEDFTGGSIRFPLQEVELFPRKGQLVFFKGDLDHIHEVTTVESGERRNIVFFYAKRGNISDRNMFG
jgi:predicted 2-oxoglutarate/Fe(II)-dependent dioxygenase YbiX